MQKNKTRKRRSKEERIIAATLKLAKSNSWKNISMKIISEEAKIPLTEIIKILPTKTAVLIEFNRLVDKRLTENNPNILETYPPTQINVLHYWYFFISTQTTVMFTRYQ